MPGSIKRAVLDTFAGKWLRAGKRAADRAGESLIARFIAPGEFEKYLESAGQPRLHLGCGPRNFPGWLNIDFFRPALHYLRTDPRVVPLDLRRSVPFADSTFDFVYSEHMHEHIPYRDGLRLAREVRRILKPGGVFRCSVPDLDLLLDICRRPITPEERPAFLRGCEFSGIGANGEPQNGVSLLNNIVGEPLHEYLYDAATLMAQLREAGYSEVKQVKPGESAHEQLRDLETSIYGRRPDKVLLDYAVWITLSVEAKK